MSRNLRILLELTTGDGRRVFVSPFHIRLVRVTDKGACIEFCEGEALNVSDRAEVVASFVDRWLSAVYLGDRHDR